jgi:hypothetical protein
MKNLFLDPKKPLSTCSSTSCQDCLLRNQLQCHFNGRVLLRFMAIALPSFFIGGIGIALVNAWFLIPWIVFFLSYFGLIEIRVMCSHCPHYAQPDTKSLQCWANYGSPKLWKYRPGPMSSGEKTIFFAGLAVIAFYPLVIILIDAQWLMRTLFVAAVTSFAILMSNLMCTRCMNFACPFNMVDKARREQFFARNPLIARAWQGHDGSL